MTTIINPGASQSVVYNRSGNTIVDVDAGASDSPVDIPHQSRLTIALINCDPVNGLNYVRLPDNAEIGDAVEMYPNPVNSIARCNAPSGETINGVIEIATSHAARFRKVASNVWRVMGEAAG